MILNLQRSRSLPSQLPCGETRPNRVFCCSQAGALFFSPPKPNPPFFKQQHFTRPREKNRITPLSLFVSSIGYPLLLFLNNCIHSLHLITFINCYFSKLSLL
ncbi:hypothetical protein L873DRAFT_1475557 [Choiromyces venosus 120613-1]|uniref:Uncharacterized protein n=1 Tax=Choiromyces venosus 120613-1 TaxID=1336337 RepID=A0A3N4J7J0_9PEZI|nr:hypothetical protein L873DRAFT_1475557 [Choiromyces venosus 120613-1]